MEETPITQEEAEEAKEAKEGTEATEEKENKTPKNEEGTEETPKPSEPEKTEKSTERQPTATEFKAVDGARKHFEEENKKLKDELLKLKPKAVPETPDEWKGKVEFLLQNQEKKYSEEEFDHIANISSRKSISLNEAAKQEDGYIQFNREKVEGENKTPSPSSPSSVTGEKTEEELSKMPDKEHIKWMKDNVNFGKPRRPGI